MTKAPIQYIIQWIIMALPKVVSIVAKYKLPWTVNSYALL